MSWRPMAVRLATPSPGFGLMQSTGINTKSERQVLGGADDWSKAHGIPSYYRGAPSPRFPAHFWIPEKNCVAYHFQPWFGHLGRLSLEKKKAANAAALSSTVRNLEQLVRLRVVLVL